VTILAKRKKEDPHEYVVIEIRYGDKKLIDCMKSIIKAKLEEE